MKPIIFLAVGIMILGGAGVWYLNQATDSLTGKTTIDSAPVPLTDLQCSTGACAPTTTPVSTAVVATTVTEARLPTKEVPVPATPTKEAKRPVTSAPPAVPPPVVLPRAVPVSPTGVPYTEFVKPDGYLNSEPFKLADYIGKKVILFEFITYTCINCQRTFPYLQSWYEKYKDEGLIVIGIHTPEFAYERDRDNVAAALKKEGITFPVVQDNDYQTWNAYGNRFWPHRYLIDVTGNIVFDHIGEGAYAETESAIKRELALLKRQSS